MTLKLAYYCSGHGFGHATRVSAFASALLDLPHKPQITIISSAPERVFAECMARGAQYRQADIDPVVVQPVAYTVDRRESIQALRKFLEDKDEKLAIETTWLFSQQIDCVLSDAAFLGCEAATMACIPSILVTNFTFDAVYSYLAIQSKHISFISLEGCSSDPPLTLEELQPLVSQLEMGYRHADALILLPGYIPIPSFFQFPLLPASDWVDPVTNRLLRGIENALSNFSEDDLHPSIPFPTATSFIGTDSLTVKVPLHRKPQRTVKRAPLLVRPTSLDMYSGSGKRRLLSSIGVPDHVQDNPNLRILVVSFGGQVLPKPDRSKHLSRPPSRNIATAEQHICAENGRLTPAHRTLCSEEGNLLLPSDSWIAIVCCAARKWTSFGTDPDDINPPKGFYFAPPDVYMPDLTAIADVLLGKLGYGTVSECIAHGTPLIYVSRPLFVEEHGLRQWLEVEGCGMEMPREEYETGFWAEKVQKGCHLRAGRKGYADQQKNRLEIEGLGNWMIEYVKTWQQTKVV